MTSRDALVAELSREVAHALRFRPDISHLVTSGEPIGEPDAFVVALVKGPDASNVVDGFIVGRQDAESWAGRVVMTIEVHRLVNACLAAIHNREKWGRPDFPKPWERRDDDGAGTPDAARATPHRNYGANTVSSRWWAHPRRRRGRGARAVNRETAIHCDRRGQATGPQRPCAFTMARETYGNSTAYRGRCTVHEGGELTIGMSHTVGRDPKRPRYTDPDYRGDLKPVPKNRR